MSDTTPNSNIPKAHRWDDVGEKCLDCGDKDWMNDPVCRPRVAEPDATTTPDISVSPSTGSTKLVPVDVLDVIDLEVEAIRLQVQRGNVRLRGTLHNLCDAHRATAEVFTGYEILLSMAKSKDYDFSDWPDGWDWERLGAAIDFASGRPSRHQLAGICAEGETHER